MAQSLRISENQQTIPETQESASTYTRFGAVLPAKPSGVAGLRYVSLLRSKNEQSHELERKTYAEVWPEVILRHDLEGY